MKVAKSEQRPEMILIAMLNLSGDGYPILRYEDIVVKAFEMFPGEFALRGYPEYPDSSDIHKPLYGPLKRSGYVLAANKTFRLTEKGAAFARRLTGVQPGSSERLDRDTERELARLLDSEAFSLFLRGEKGSILDTDFYSYLGVTVRTPRNDFLGRLARVGSVVEDGKGLHSEGQHSALVALHEFLLAKFDNLIKRFELGGKQ